MRPRRPLLVIEDRHLLDQVLRLTAAAGCEADHVPDAAAARPFWSAAPIVLLDPAAAADCRSHALPRRPGVHVVCLGPPPDGSWQHAVEIGAERVLALPDAEPVLAGELADVVDRPAQLGRALAVLGGRGGAGASVFAAALAVQAVNGGAHALLVDCDPFGGGLDLVLGAEDTAGLRWPGLALTGGRIAAASLHAALPRPDSCAGRLTLLSCARRGSGPGPAAVRAVVAAGKRAGDTVVCDLSRHLDPVAHAVLEQADLALLVVPAEVRACAAASQVAADVSRAIDLPLAATMPAEPALDDALDRGRLPFHHRGPLAAAARAVLAQVPATSEGLRP